jgi:hypothetical protein
MLTFIFAAGMLIAGQLYMESRSANAAVIVPARIAQSPAQENRRYETQIRENQAIAVRASQAVQTSQSHQRR